MNSRLHPSPTRHEKRSNEKLSSIQSTTTFAQPTCWINRARVFSRATCLVLIFCFSSTADAIQTASSDQAQTQTQTESTWREMEVPGVWESVPQFKQYDGIAWYRCQFRIPEQWAGRQVSISIENVDNCFELFVGNNKIGSAGKFPPKYKNGLSKSQLIPIEKTIAQPGETLGIALRVYDHDGRGGFKGRPPFVVAGGEAISLKGKWSFRTGDKPEFANQTIKNIPLFKTVINNDIAKNLLSGKSIEGPMPPSQSAQLFQVPSDLKLTQLLTEPLIAQPVFMNFDEKGRMWVCEYRQYPSPAGLKILSRDQYWRNVYDKVPPAPPNHFVGKDQISIHEDTNGDGVYDKSKIFVKGLNICTAVEKGRGGVWVLNPPYLLFYPDKNDDDIPDGDPQVVLSGFGMEDTHSVANSLRWGPDGWLYAAQGSTVTGNIIRPGIDKKPRFSMGQLIWRYHPEKKIYEIYAEGGGNAFGVEIDSKGRVYSGHNGGDTRGFHYTQGGYLRKGFTKHGSLSNPYAFGFFPAMKHERVPRFTHNFILYEADSLPQKYHGKLFGVEPLQGQIVQSEITPRGSTFQTRDINRVVKSRDTWFRPVDIKQGPDGAIFFCDWYDGQVGHYRNHEGQMDGSNGRIYRLSGQNHNAYQSGDLSKLPSTKLVQMLGSPNSWIRRKVIRILGDRKDKSVVTKLQKMLDDSKSYGSDDEKSQIALDTLWAIHVVGALDEETTLKAIAHPNPFVRLWAVRLNCDDFEISDRLFRNILSLANSDDNVEVRAQLLCSAKRLKVQHCLPIAAAIVARDLDSKDPYIPLLSWWAIESKCQSDPEKVVEFWTREELWQTQMARQHLLGRQMQRFAASGTRADFVTCAKLLDLASNAETQKILVQAFEKGVQGQSLAKLPAPTLLALKKVGGGSLPLQVRLGDQTAIAKSLKLVADRSGKDKDRAELIATLCQTKQESSVAVILQLLKESPKPVLKQACLAGIQNFSQPEIGKTILEQFPKFDAATREIALSTLASRPGWAVALLQQVQKGTIKKDTIPKQTLQRIAIHNSESVQQLLKKNYANIAGATNQEIREKIAEALTQLSRGKASPYKGKEIYQKTCAKCHRLFSQGGGIGPDLTSYQRTDLENMLLHIVNPNAEIREGFENYMVESEDGRLISGLKVDEDKNVVVIRGEDKQDVVISQSDIIEISALPNSLMPEGLLDELTEQMRRDLFAYLRSTQPLNN